MSKMLCYLGADGGGTKTLGVLASDDGRELARARAGATNPNVVGVEQAAAHLVELMLACCAEAGVAPGDIRGAAFGLAGAGNPLLQEPLRAALQEESRRQGITLPPVEIHTDARIALEGAFAGGPGIIVIAGTGSAVLGKTPEGEIRLVGGWGRTVGDEGSGYYLGVEALRAVARMFDGRSAATSLRGILEREFGFDARAKIVNAVYQEGFAIPSLAPAVIEAAEGGDVVALEIVRRGADSLAEQVNALVPRFPSGPGVVFVGGLIDHPGLPEGTLRRSLLALAPSVVVRSPLEEPASGAVRLAKHAFSPR
jgi:N-acetylglucosamine kinase-like BadF-type ATPase